MADIKTVQALVDALEQMRKGANARGHDLMDNSYPQKYWYGLRDQADVALEAGRALIAQMQRDAVQPTTDHMQLARRIIVAMGRAVDPSSEPGADYMVDRIAAMLVAAPQPAPEPQQDQLQQPDGHSTRASGVCASTVLPWRITSDADDWSASHDGNGSSSYCGIRDADGKVVALAVAHDPGYWSNPDCRSIAEQIVQCVNTQAQRAVEGSLDARKQDDHAGSPAPSEGWRKCEFCGCNTNAKRRMCCTKGCAADDAAAQSSKAALSDDEIVGIANETRTAEPGADGYILPISFARAILARTGITRKPLTDEQLRDIFQTRQVFTVYEAARLVEAAHGITPQAGKESGE